jgi:hypothetical protein
VVRECHRQLVWWCERRGLAEFSLRRHHLRGRGDIVTNDTGICGWKVAEAKRRGAVADIVTNDTGICGWGCDRSGAPAHGGRVCGLPIRDTADCQSALRTEAERADRSPPDSAMEAASV